MGSSGKSSGREPDYAVPSGGTSPNSGFNWTSVLGDGSGTVDSDQLAANRAASTQSAAAAQPAAAAAAGPSAGGSTDAFAQQRLDDNKRKQMAGYMLMLDPRRGGQYMEAMQSAPQASNPTEQLMSAMNSSRNQLAHTMSRSSRR